MTLVLVSRLIPLFGRIWDNMSPKKLLKCENISTLMEFLSKIFRRVVNSNIIISVHLNFYWYLALTPKQGYLPPDAVLVVYLPGEEVFLWRKKMAKPVEPDQKENLNRLTSQGHRVVTQTRHV